MGQDLKLNIAVVGTGISGLGASWLLSKKHNVTVYEASNKLGGHANTISIKTEEGPIAVDTGFIVCNNRNYENFLTLMDHLGVSYSPTEMSFGVSIGRGSFEYAGSDNIKALFAQKRNIFRVRFWKMILEILRFYKESKNHNFQDSKEITLREYLIRNGYNQSFLRDHILPMTAAIWSTPSAKVGDFPFTSFLNFCQNHGLLQIKNRPQWFTISGGSQKYVEALAKDTNASFKLQTKVEKIIPKNGGVIVRDAKGEEVFFDKILVATHANTALQMLDQPNSVEKSILGAFKYSKNRAVLHSDKNFMPKRKNAWSSWNYIQDNEENDDALSVTYWMNKLQHLNTKMPLFLTLNPSNEIEPDLIHYEIEYDHPIFNLKSLESQKKILSLMGYRNIWYAGAHLGYGFHEDGLQSGLLAAEIMGSLKRPWILEDMNNRLIYPKESIGVMEKHIRESA
ncbi:MAG: NAD(P)/FAD-dependent oxidoreductase [Sphingomonadales bacterium]|jgi:predicted NAD/FAD-binding protein